MYSVMSKAPLIGISKKYRMATSLNVRNIPLGAALQAVEDGTPGVRFVVCDYGILVTSDTSPAAAMYVSANEFWRKAQEEAGPERAREPAAARPPQPGRDPFGPPKSTEAEEPRPDEPSGPARDPFSR